MRSSLNESRKISCNCLAQPSHRYQDHAAPGTKCLRMSEVASAAQAAVPIPSLPALNSAHATMWNRVDPWTLFAHLNMLDACSKAKG